MNIILYYPPQRIRHNFKVVSRLTRSVGTGIFQEARLVFTHCKKLRLRHTPQILISSNSKSSHIHRSRVTRVPGCFPCV